MLILTIWVRRAHHERPTLAAAWDEVTAKENELYGRMLKELSEIHGAENVRVLRVAVPDTVVSQLWEPPTVVALSKVPPPMPAHAPPYPPMPGHLPPAPAWPLWESHNQPPPPRPREPTGINGLWGDPEGDGC